jgi:hypothetical protein
VRAIASYGSTALDAWDEHSDIDLIGIVKSPPVDTIHFFARGIPVDLSLRDVSSGIEFLPPEELRVVWDPESLLAGDHAPSDASWWAGGARSGLRHANLKLRKLNESDPEAARLLARAESYWLLHTYFMARRGAFPDVERALALLRESDLPFLAALLALVESVDTDQHTEAAARALAPVGEWWRAGDPLLIGWDGEPSETQQRAVEDLLSPVLELAAPQQASVGARTSVWA